MPSEANIQGAIIEALVWDGWMILRVNQGARTGFAYQCSHCGYHGDEYAGYVRFAWWQHLNIDPQDKGISDILALKKSNNPIFDDCWVGRLLAIEVKAPGKGDKLARALVAPLEVGNREITPWFPMLDKREKNQARFLWSIQDHGGIAIVADDLSDVAPYLDRIEVE